MAKPRPYRPTPWEESCNFHYWDAEQNDLDRPDIEGFHYLPKKETENANCRIDLSQEVANQNSRFYGYIGEIKTGNSDNTTTPFEIYVVGRIGFMEKERDRSG